MLSTSGQSNAVVDPSRTRAAALNGNHTSSTSSTMSVPPTNLQHIWVVTGPAGSGKSTVGKYLQQALGIPYLEGDDYHPKSNKDKMSSGTPLTDADRWDWLISLRSAATACLSPSPENNHTPPAGVVVACSALKKKYRDVMRVAAYGADNVRIHFVYLKLDPDALYQRVSKRQAHYMKQSMVESQLRDLEEPEAGEWDALTVNVVGNMGMESVQGEVMRVVSEELEKFGN
ncbi:P-loop containing nucleoside triphosphate hydrolase protein [Aspergillus egyptiacus]|nr:P-loop containing nucleoside triphosphate hydrolase protein [Aspergillus egyptiacus]